MLTETVSGTERRTADGGSAAQPRTPSALPCQNRNNCIQTEGERTRNLTSRDRKAAFQLRGMVGDFVDYWGRDHCAFWTPTVEEMMTPREMARRWHSFMANEGEWIRAYCRVLEPQDRGAPHYHLLVAVPWNVRPDAFDWVAFIEAQKRKDETRGEYDQRRRTPQWRALRRRYVESAAPEMVALWKRLRDVLPRYGFGRSEFVPVRKVGAIDEYVGKYLESGIRARSLDWKGVRLVETDRRTSVLWKDHARQFMFVSPRSALWRWQVGEFARRHGIRQDDFDGMVARFGKKWAYHQREAIMALEPPDKVVQVTERDDGELELLTLHDVWQMDRFLFSQEVANQIGCTQSEAYMQLYQSHLWNSRLDFEVPRWSGTSGVELDKFTIWN